MLLFATLVVNNATVGYISGLVPFVIYINLAVNNWNKSAFTSSNNSVSYFTSHKCCSHGKVTLKSQISLNWLTVSSILCFLISSTFLSFLFLNDQEIMCVTSDYNHISKVIINIFQYISNNILIYMQQLFIINIPYSGALLSIDHLVVHPYIIWIDTEPWIFQGLYIEIVP